MFFNSFFFFFWKEVFYGLFRTARYAALGYLTCFT